ncbi:ArsR/SmtB family transcription factor [Pontibacillus salicampi]|uniref:ArsR/SmtB family transcription factor n=2 Tax=Pontibacillus salicampi TaxID=1449801 RepID=A0ABV6LRB0_9BACI
MNRIKIATMKIPYHPPIDSVHFTKVLHALSEPNRVKIIRCLDESIENNCTAYSLELKMPKSTISHHIKVLREAGLIKARIEGKEHIYSLRREEIDQKFPGLLQTVTEIKEEDI